MAYITTSDLAARLGTVLYARLTDRVHGTTGDATVAQQIVDEAEAEANAYLAKRYATPIDLAAHPELATVLKQRVLDLAEHIAWRGSPFVSDLPTRVEALYEQSRTWFSQLSTGGSVLPADAPPASRTAEDNAARYRSRTRAFTSEELDGL